MHSRSNGQFSVVSAGTIIANIFQLIDGAGNVVGELGQRVIGVDTSPALLMNNSGGPSAGYLAWRYGGLGSTYSVVLAGPGAGARLTLSGSGASSGATLFAENTITVNTFGSLSLSGATVALGSLYNVLQGGYPLVGVHASIAAARPGSGGGAPAPTAGAMYYATDTQTLSQYDGSGWVILSEPSQTWTPTVSSLTVGNGTTTARYKRSDGYCDFVYRLDFGSTSAMGTNPIIALPFNAFDLNEGETFTVELFSPGGRHYGVSYAASTSTIGLLAWNTAGAYAVGNIVTPLIPFAWGAAGFIIVISGRYRMATRYL